MQEMQIEPNTGFHNRNSCLKLTSNLVEQVSQSGESLAVLWLDIDRFKHVNESFGYQGGDSIIEKVAQRIREQTNGKAEVGRMGADEFLLLLPDFDSDSAESLGIELMRAIELPLVMGDFKVRLTVSIGIAVMELGESATELIERADWAKNTAKQQGGNRFVISGSELVPGHMGIIHAREELEVEYLLHTALDKGGLQLHYQPILGFKGEVLSVEALMRCTVGGKSIPPARFFPVAEKSGLIALLSEWCLLEGTRQARHLSKMGLATKISINVSRTQLTDVHFAQSLKSAISQADVDPNLIELEFSESIFMDATETIQSNLRIARELGVSLAIDNFGTGFSCLANLKNIPASKLKLGRAFCMSFLEDSRSMSVVRSMVQLGKDLGMTVIAEGVETKEQMEALRELSVDGIQGYYYAKPMGADALFSWLKSREH
jgi:diguanylate cyclase (GGDEF)-like protein